MKPIFFILILFIFILGCTNQIACTEDARLCPDGSGVGRDPNNNCEFFPCPDKSSSSTLTEQQSKETAKSFVETSATYKFDGSGLSFKEVIPMDCPYCWQLVFEFQSSAAGYGDREGMMLAQVITSHEAVVTVTEGKVDSAILDEKWDMVKQEAIKE